MLSTTARSVLLPLCRNLVYFCGYNFGIAEILLGYYIEVVVELIDKRNAGRKIDFIISYGVSFSKCMTSAAARSSASLTLSYSAFHVFGSCSSGSGSAGLGAAG